jgi:ATP-dependent RNA helicase DeaD
VNPEEVTIKVKTTTAETIRQRYWLVSGYHKLDALTRILEVENFDGIIIFVRTKTETVELAEKLQARGYEAAALNGDIPQNLRERTVDQLKRGKLDILVATDVVARGLDVERISHVINYDIPYDTESYVHRIGRTGRAGRSGEAILFVAPRERNMLRNIERATKKKIDLMELPSTEVINDKRVANFLQRITDMHATEEWQSFLPLLETYQNEHNLPPLEVAAVLAKLMQGNEPLLLKDKPIKQKLRERAERQDRKSRKSKDRGRRSRSDVSMETFRIEVGRRNNVNPGNIVGAIANEAGIDNEFIGRINIYDDYSTVDLPKGMPKDIFNELKRVRVANRPMNISRAGSEGRKPVGGKKKFTPKKNSKNRDNHVNTFH